MLNEFIRRECFPPLQTAVHLQYTVSFSTFIFACVLHESWNTTAEICFLWIEK